MKVTSSRTPAAIFAAGAALVAALILAVAPTAHADRTWGAIDTGAGGQWSISNGVASERGAADVAARRCGGECRTQFTFTDCAALNRNVKDFYWASGATKDQAESAAMRRSPGSTPVTWACNNPPASGPTSWR